MSIFGGGSYTGRFPDRKSRLGPLGLAVAVLGGSLGLLVAYHPEVAGQQVKTRYIEVPRCRLQTFRKSAKFLAEAWAVPDESFNVGEPLRLQMRVSSPAYMNVFHVSTSCKVTRLVHNQRMVETQIVDFPPKDSGMEIVVKPPAGDEAFYFVATRQKMSVLAEADILRGDAIASLDLTPEEFFVRLRQASGRINPDDLSITTLRTSVARH